MEEKDWKILTYDKAKAQKISKDLNMSEKIAGIFVARGMDTTAKVKEFIDFNQKDVPDISLLKDADIAVDRIGEAIMNNEHIVIYADYDADGTCAASVMIRGLRNLGANVDYYTNDRLRQGFGMKVDGVKEILSTYSDISLIITVDNGIVAFDAAEYIRKQGIDLIITDHHEPDANGLLPEALAVVDHKRLDDKYPFKELCGTGIAYRLMEDLYTKIGKKLDYVYELLPLVALGTVADCVSMTGENRYYTKIGLSWMGKDTIPAFKVLSELFAVKAYTEDTVGFYYGPMINASSRLDGNAMKPIRFFTTDDYDEAMKLGMELFETNNERKEISNESEQVALDQIEKEGKENDNVIIVYDPSFKEGIIGIIAGRITEKYGKPSIVFTDNGTNLKGSARSVESFNIKESFDALADTIVNYGGHAMAAGITIDKSDLDLFTKQINLYAEGKVVAHEEDILVDLNLETPNEMDIKVFDDFNKYLRPFGTDWPKAKVRVGGWALNVNTVRALKDIHLKVQNGGYSLLFFNTGVDFANELTNSDILVNKVTPCTLEAIGDFDINVFKGNVTYQLIVQDNNLKIQKNTP